MKVSSTRLKLAIIALSAVMFCVFAVREASRGGEDIFEGVFFTFAIYGVPFAVFAFVVWSCRWPELVGAEDAFPVRRRVRLAGELMAGVSSGLFLLTLPFTPAIAEHEALGESWVLIGIVAAIIGVIGAVAGSPRRWVHAIGSALLVGCWLFLAMLFARMMLD